MGHGLVAGVDCYTQAVVVVMVDVDSGKLVASGRVEREVCRSGAACETDPWNWWQALAGAISQTGCSGKIMAVSVAAQQLGAVALDADRRPLRRAMFRDDTRSAQAAEELRRLLVGAAAKAAEILIGQPAVDEARRWNFADGTRARSRPPDHAAIDRIARVRDAAHDLNASEVFTGSTAVPSS